MPFPHAARSLKRFPRRLLAAATPFVLAVVIMVEKLLPSFMPISKQIATLVKLDTYSTTLDSVPLRRVANFTQKGGMLGRPFNFSPLLFR